MLFTKIRKNLDALIVGVLAFLLGLFMGLRTVETTEATENAEPDEIKVIVYIESKPEYTSLGEFKITAYCSCKKCCGQYADNRPNGKVYGASGSELTPNYSIAVDPDVIPYGTKVYIDGREYIAQDTGGAINGNRIDLYMSNHEEALEWGVQCCEVFIETTKFYG